MMMDSRSEDGLLFITYTEAQYQGKVRDSATRQKVRKHAWNAWRTNEAQRRLKSRSTRPLKQSQGRFRLRDEDSEATKDTEQSQLLQSPSPFQSILESSGEKAWELLSFYYYRFRQNSIAINVEGEWISFTFFDQASRHAQLALIALNAELDSRAPVQTLTMNHTAAAIKLVRSKLQETTELPDDSLIGAVALLVIVESMQDDRGSSAVHFQGLNQMVAVRGGFNAFSNTKTLQRVIAWARRCYWLRWRDAPDQPWLPSLSSSDFGAKTNSEETDINRSGRILDIDRFYGIVAGDLLAILAEFRFIASFPATTTTRSDRLQISESIYDVEYQLMLLHETALTLNEDSPKNVSSPSEFLRIAAQIYDFLALRQMNPRSKIVQHYAEALKLELRVYLASQKDQFPFENGTQDLLIWAMVLLLLAAYNEAAFHEIAILLWPMLHLAGVHELEQLAGLLETVAWMDASLQEELSLLWKKIALSKL